MTTKREDRMIVKMSLKDRFHTATSISRAFMSKQESQSLEKISRWSNKEKLVAQIPCRKPLILKKSKGLSWFRHWAYPVDRGTMEYGSL